MPGLIAREANVETLLHDEESAFRYLVQSRCSNLAKFDGGLRPAKTIAERWCRDRVVENIRRIYSMRSRIEVVEGNGLQAMHEYAADPKVGCYADPPYPEKGHTLYRHGIVDHPKLFSLLAKWHVHGSCPKTTPGWCAGG